MNTILIIDDNPEQSELVQSNIELEIEKTDEKIQVKTNFPLSKLEDYDKFLQDEGICVLIVDEKLNDQANSNGETVSYLGHSLTKYIRERQKDLPIFTITGYDSDADLQSSFREYEQIINRKDFYEHTDKYTPVIFRAAGKFIDRHSTILSEFTQIAQEIASGDNSEEKLDRLKAIQTTIELPISNIRDRREWLNQFEAEIAALQEFQQKLSIKISKQ